MGLDTTLPITVPGEAARGAEVRGEEAAIEVFPPETSPRVEVETFRVHGCEGVVGVVALDVRTNT